MNSITSKSKGVGGMATNFFFYIKLPYIIFKKESSSSFCRLSVLDNRIYKKVFKEKHQ